MVMTAIICTNLVMFAMCLKRTAAPHPVEEELKKERLCRLGESKHHWQLNIDPNNPQYRALGTGNRGYWKCWCSHLRHGISCVGHRNVVAYAAARNA